MSVPKEVCHLVLNVTDVERSTKSDRDVMGFQMSGYRPDRMGAFLTCGVVHHNLVRLKAPEGAQPRQKGQIGLNHCSRASRKASASHSACSATDPSGSSSRSATRPCSACSCSHAGHIAPRPPRS